MNNIHHNYSVHFVGNLYIMNLIIARKMEHITSLNISVTQLMVECAMRHPVEMLVSVILMCLYCLIRSLTNVIRTGRDWLTGSLLFVHICPAFVERISLYPNLFP
jgi:hypothetical protein